MTAANDPEKVDLVKNQQTEGKIDHRGTMVADDGIAIAIVVDGTGPETENAAHGVEIVIVPEVEIVIDDEIQEETDDETTEEVSREVVRVGDEVVIEIKNKNDGNQNQTVAVVIGSVVREASLEESSAARVRNQWVIHHLVVQLPAEIFKQVYLN